jgi:hypothetical protein
MLRRNLCFTGRRNPIWPAALITFALSLAVAWTVVLGVRTNQKVEHYRWCAEPKLLTRLYSITLARQTSQATTSIDGISVTSKPSIKFCIASAPSFTAKHKIRFDSLLGAGSYL